MATQVTKTIPLRDGGHDEYWLQDQIWAAPEILGLGQLDALSKERRQSSGGRLDLLLKDPEEDTMYEVEVMLGATDESHIIRTIEYWDAEKRRWPQRNHFAVLVAEEINRRFFNVIHLLSHSIPIIAIQVALVEVAGNRALHFTKVLDTYEEVDDGSVNEDVPASREMWTQKSPWTMTTAERLLEIASTSLGEVKLKPTRNYLSIAGKNNYFSLHKRTNPKSLLRFRIAPTLLEQAEEILDSAQLSFTRRPRGIAMPIDSDSVNKNRSTFESLSNLVRQTWAIEPD